MGHKKKGFNWKARQKVETIVDKSEQNKIKVEFNDGKYDESNALVLPSKKRRSKKKRVATVQKILTKKQRKNLEKIISKKKKKEGRASLIEELNKVQASPAELERLTSIAAVQTKGLKRRWDEDKPLTILSSVSAEKINPIKGSKKKMRLMALVNDVDKKSRISDPNIVDLETSSDDYSSDEVSEPEDIKAEPLDTDCLSNEEIMETEKHECKIENGLTVEISDDEEIKGAVSGSTNGVEESKESSKRDEVKCINGFVVATVKQEPMVKSEPAVFVTVTRDPKIQEARLKLPILGEEQVVMEAINDNPVVILAGETGSGKTTQVPQFLYEAGFARDGRVIGVTEPRRVAAISMSKRVGEELALAADRVSYLIRFEGNATPDTQIKFMTDGVLLKEIQSDLMLSKYSAVVVDEAHERSVYTDILIGLLSRIVPLRAKRGNPLKMIIMSATLRVDDFINNKQLFKIPPPVIKVESRQYPVTIHFNKRTNPDYVKEAFRKTCRIHTTLPEGGILVFVTGQQEVNLLVKKLRQAFPLKSRAQLNTSTVDSNQEEEEEEDLTLNSVLERAKKKKRNEIKLPEINLDSYESTAPPDDTDGDLLDTGTLSSDEEDDVAEWDSPGSANSASAEPLWVLPLYSLLPSYKQSKVFDKPPEGCRLCVVATNVAETSLTIPNVKYVVDTGKVKTKLYDKTTGVTAFSVLWTSKAAADQRAGRAGRTSPGHCYRLFSSAVYNDEFQGWAVPEMERRGVDDIVLQMKALGIEKVANFPFPSPPDRAQLAAAELRLTTLGAIAPPTSGQEGKCTGGLTRLGLSMSAFPVAPRFSKMLCLSHQHDLLQYTVALVAALSVQEFLLSSSDQKTKSVWRKWAGHGHSLLLGEVMVVLRGVCGGEFARSKGTLTEFCERHGLREKAVVEARRLRLQLTKEILLAKPDLQLVVDPYLKPPTDQQAKLLRQIVLSGLVDQVAKRCDEETPGHDPKKRPVYRTSTMDQDVFLPTSSPLYKDPPDYLVYLEIFESKKLYIRGAVAVEPEWLPKFAPSLCRLEPPLLDPPPRYDDKTNQLYCHITGTFGKSAWALPKMEIEFPAGIDRFRWFASFLLDGSVCPPLAEYTSSLLSPPKAMVKTWARLLPRTEIMLKTLVSEDVDSKEKLLQVWESNPKFLLNAYLEWLPESAENEVRLSWPPL